MGKYRSKTGCSTCRSRRVKCDEERPVCGQCGKKNRTCRWESAGVNIRQYQPNEGASAASSSAVDGPVGDDDGQLELDGEAGRSTSPPRRRSRAEGSGSVTEYGSDRPSSDMFNPSPFADSTTSTSLTRVPEHIFNPSSTSPLSPAPYFHSVLPTTPQILSRQDAALVSYYTEHLGRWLDVTDASRQFTLTIPILVKRSSILLHAVLAFSAKHCEDIPTAEQAHQRCLGLLIDSLQTSNAVHDDALLCAIVILRYVEQLDVSLTGSDTEKHLSGFSAVLRASQGQTVDPSASTLRQAAFWVYVRQCLYTATVNQHPPELNVNMQLNPVASVFPNDHPALNLGRETAWANTMTWLCACVVHYSFDGGPGTGSYDPNSRLQKWNELWDSVQRWNTDRTSSFDPIWSGAAGENSIFPEVWFTADWHAMAYCFYHFACLQLITYKPGTRFAARNVGAKLKDSDHQVLRHARALCGACVCSPQNVSCLQVLCHSIFIWGPLMSDQEERNAILSLLENLQRMHTWPTLWIRNALREEWNMT